MTMGERIRSLREAKDLRQVDLAARVGIPAQSLWRIEAGEVVNPRLDVLAKLARELETTIDALVAEVPMPESVPAAEPSGEACS